MAAAAIGWLSPVPAAIVQEVIDVAVILNALRALTLALRYTGRSISAKDGQALHRDHLALIERLDRLQAIGDALDSAAPEEGAALIMEANSLVQTHVVVHERDDEGHVQ